MTIETALRHRLGAFRLDLAFASAARVTALFGPSGSGKNRSIRDNAVAGLSRPDWGLRNASTARTLSTTEAGVFVPPPQGAGSASSSKEGARSRTSTVRQTCSSDVGSPPAPSARGTCAQSGRDARAFGPLLRAGQAGAVRDGETPARCTNRPGASRLARVRLVMDEASPPSTEARKAGDPPVPSSALRRRGQRADRLRVSHSQ